MGADTFFTQAKGDNANEAFANAVADAAWESGHGGYTGTIAEKQEFVEIPLPEGADPVEEANRLIDEGDSRIDDKWGPAGCFDLGDDEYMFFGWASS